ncbi:MAG: SCP2 sterol-binding domain-containing protein [Methanomassiliicoccus sp.]|nr:SCP2 sterol-binding domain-containing protein [Methanomassiliicoccus sp.]
MSVEPQLQELIRKFNDKVENDPKLKTEIGEMNKKVMIDLDSEKYNFHLHDQKIDELVVGEISDPDLTITSDPETISGIINGEIKPMKAFALRKVRIKGNIDDMLRLRHLF